MSPGSGRGRRKLFCQRWELLGTAVFLRNTMSPNWYFRRLRAPLFFLTFFLSPALPGATDLARWTPRASSGSQNDLSATRPGPKPQHHGQRQRQPAEIDPPDHHAASSDRKSTRLNSSHVAISYAV